ncbi:MAG: autotransporter outer membrane beta-barrel domain-containing protein [Proteobacteria bacterium]|nr:autotransporter outer membrane beta-barrel domain-containing protein [Pseudomonadota bacterium]
MVVGSGGIVPRIRNEGSITATTSGPAGGTAVALLIEAGASVGSLVNTGVIFATAVTGDSSIANLSGYAIRDLAGTLISITNSGTIAVSGTALDGGATLFAADLSKATSAVTFVNSGKIEGEIAFGQAGNTFIIDGVDAEVRGRFFSTGAGTLDIIVEQGSFLSDRTLVRDFTVGSRGTVEFALSRTTTASALVVATGATNFAAGSRIVLTPSTFVPNVGIYTLLTSAGGLSFANFADTTALPLPFLFNGSFSRDANTLFLTLQRKTATQLGLSRNLAALYEPAMDAAAFDDPYGAALLSLKDLSEVEAVLTTMTPAISYGARALIAAVMDHPTGPIGVRQRDLIFSTEDQTTFFAQEFYLDLNTSTNPRSPSFFASGMGVTTGTEWGAVRTGRIGVAYTFYAGQVTENNPRTSKANITLNLLSLYGGWRLQDFFVSSQATMGFAELVSKRLVLAGPVTRTVTGNWSGYLGSAGVTTGFIIRLGAIEIIPQVNVDGLYVYQTSYSESGGGTGVNLNIGAVATQSVRLFAGVVAQSDYHFTGGMFRPQLLAGWTHEVMDDAPVIDASFQALPGSQFSLVGPTADQQKFVGGASLAYTLNNWTAGLNYGASTSSNSLLQSARVKLTSRF